MNIFTPTLAKHHLLLASLLLICAIPLKTRAQSQSPSFQYGKNGYTFTVGNPIYKVTPINTSNLSPAGYYDKAYPTAQGDSLSGFTAFLADVNGAQYVLNSTSVVQPDLSSNHSSTVISNIFGHATGIATNNKSQFGEEDDQYIYVSDAGIPTDPAGKIYKILTYSPENNQMPNTATRIDQGYPFIKLQYIAVDPAGNVFATDNGANAIVEIPVNGGTPFKYGPAINAPLCIAVDNSDNIYYTQTGSTAVMELPVGSTSPVMVANLSNKKINALNVDPAGNLFISYSVNGSSGGITEVWANKQGGTVSIVPGGLGPVYGVGVDLDGNLYALDNNQSTHSEAIEQVTPSGGFYLQKPLPSGLNFNSKTGVISGTPTIVTPKYLCIVTALNDIGPSSAYIYITVNGPANLAALDSILLRAGTLSPAFADSLTSYKVIVPNYQSTESFIPYAAAGENITINGVSVASGKTSSSSQLNVGPNIYYFTVTSKNGTVTKSDTVTVYRKSSVQKLAGLAISPGKINFYPGITSYNVTVPSSPVTLTPTADSSDMASIIKINGVVVASGTASPPNAVSGINNIIKVVFLSSDKIDSVTYTVNVSAPVSPQPLTLSTLNTTISSGTINNIVPYPVPLRNTLNLNLGADNINNVSVAIYSILDGKKVYTKAYINQSGVLQLDVSNLRSGIYTLHLATNNTEKVFKIIK